MHLQQFDFHPWKQKCMWMTKHDRLQLALSFPVLSSETGIKEEAVYMIESYMDWLHLQIMNRKEYSTRGIKFST